MTELPRRAQRSLLKLAASMGNEVLEIPITIYNDADYPYPAFTDNHGVHVGSSIIEHEPQNLGVYVGHEILHHVFEDEFIRSMFDPDTVNRGSDHVINQVLKSIYGLDVRKVKHIGLYDKRYRSKTIYQVCCDLSAAPDCAVRACGRPAALTNPAVYAAALKIRARLAEHSGLKHLELGKIRELVLLSESQGQELFNELKSKFWRNVYRHMRDVNYDQLIRSLFGRFFATTVRYDIRRDMPNLSHSHGIALSIKTTKLRKMSVGDAAMSLAFAQQFVKDLTDYGTPNWREAKISRIGNRIEALRRKMADRSKYSKRERAKFRLSVDRAIEKIEILKATQPIDSILTVENRIKVRARNDQATGFMLREALTIQEDHLPRMKVNEVMRTVRKITRASVRACAELYKIKNDLESFVKHQKHSAVKTVEEKTEHRGEDEDHAKRQQIPRITRTRQRVEPQFADDQNENSENGKENKKSAAKDEQIEIDGSKPLMSSRSSKSQEEEETEQQESTTPKDGNGNSEHVMAAGHSDGIGTGTGESAVSVDMRMLQAVSMNRRLLKKILIEADVFREKLSNVSRSHIDDNALVDRSYTFGNDVQRADTSALAKMVGKMTKLAFYADIANHALLQNVGTAPRRGSVIIALDCSGSMRGDRYVIAAGFATAMFNVMSDIGRGCALVKFASGVDGVYVCDVGQPVDLLTLVESLTCPSYGGTDFDIALDQSLLIAETLDWKNTQLILVTDGQDVVAPSVLEAVQKRLRVTAVIVGNQSAAIEGIGDTKHVRSLDDLRNGLLGIGRALC